MEKRMTNTLKVRLSLAMFLEFFTWGAWYVTLGTYLFSRYGASAVQVGSAYANFSLAAALSPVFVGFIADRYFSAQRVLGALHLMGAVVLVLLSCAPDYRVFWILLLLYTLLFAPTMALVNSVTFGQLRDGGREFPLVRVFGTAGWIVAGLLLGYLGLEQHRGLFYLAASSSAMLGLLSFTLPDTPPARTGRVTLTQVLGGEALVLFRERSFAVFFLASLAICIPLSFYYSFANPFLNDLGVANAAGKMTLGQLSEVCFLLIIPLAFRRLGIRAMLAVGIVAWVVRYGLFAFGDADGRMGMLYAGILLHGVCYDFFFVSGQIYVDRVAGERIRHAAQGLITFATYGVGMLIGSYFSGWITAWYRLPDGSSTQFDWQGVWLVPAGIAAAVLVIFLLVFRERKPVNNGRPDHHTSATD